MSGISHLRCFNHADREAVARCPQCSRTFCRECITEHEERVICARCLAALVSSPRSKLSHLGRLLGGAWCLMSFTVLWAVLYYLGKILLRIPANFHETLFPLK